MRSARGGRTATRSARGGRTATPPGLPQGLASTGNQAAVYAQAPPGATGAAAGLQRTAQYLGAITAAALIGLFYGRRATDGGLHDLALTTGVLSVLLLVLTATDRALRHRRRPPPPTPAPRRGPHRDPPRQEHHP